MAIPATGRTVMFAFGQHVSLTKRIYVVWSKRRPEYGGHYLVKPLWPHSPEETVLHRVQEYMLHELTEESLCRRRTPENFCTCGLIHVSSSYAIEKGRAVFVPGGDAADNPAA
jgi:hypothetical protein